MSIALTLFYFPPFLLYKKGMTNSKKIIIAIDGPSASGKGSLAKKLAAHFDYDFLDTGALYRRVALKCIENGIKPDENDKIIEISAQLSQNLHEKYNDDDLRDDKVGQMASIFAKIPKVRANLFDFQRNFAQNTEKGAVLDGRDIGTTICPDADVKLFITASAEKRAERRTLELQSRGFEVTKAQVLAEMQERDARDAHTLDVHLQPDHDCHVIDTSDMTPNQVMDAALEIIGSHS
jgi:cytidylate kinase